MHVQAKTANKNIKKKHVEFPNHLYLLTTVWLALFYSQNSFNFTRDDEAIQANWHNLLADFLHSVNSSDYISRCQLKWTLPFDVLPLFKNTHWKVFIRAHTKTFTFLSKTSRLFLEQSKALFNPLRYEKCSPMFKSFCCVVMLSCGFRPCTSFSFQTAKLLSTILVLNLLVSDVCTGLP